MRRENDNPSAPGGRLALVRSGLAAALRLAPLLLLLLSGACNTTDLVGGGGDVDLSASFPTPDGGRGCGLRTCDTAGATCGPIGDGCGGIIDCGTCSAPQSCGGGGQPSACGGTMGCTPKTCAQLGFNCGPAGDGCGNLLDCGTCGAGESCGTGGKPGLCAPTNGPVDGGGACVAKTCAQLGYDCGPAGDGCGGALNCGTCAAGKACGTGGKPSVCGPASGCVPRTCAMDGFNCGMTGDGCGGVLNCGTCTMPEICGGAGMPNMCGRTPVMDMGMPNRCDGGTTTISGTVLAPTNAANGYGQPDPIYGAVVYTPSTAVAPFPVGVSCDKCGAGVSGTPTATAITGPDGKFVLQNAPCGQNIKVVIQVGRWRRQVTLPSVTCCTNTAMTAAQSRLPRNKTEGDIPLIAVVTGSADPIECVLPKIGIDASEFTLPSGTGRVRFYNANGANIGNNTPAASALWGDRNELAKYDAIIADCEGSQIAKSAAWQANVIDYTSKGGRLFASHFSYTWLYNVAPFSTTAQWSVGQAAPPNLTATIDTSFPKGVAFAAWLKNIGASAVLGKIPVEVVRHNTNGVNNPPSQRWMYADPAVSANTPLEFTFNTPVGVAAANQCGRVLYSDFHVNTGGSGSGRFPGSCNGAAPMTPQEKVLEFMLFDLTSCIQPDVPPPSMCTPRTCAQQNINCGPAGDGCGALIQCGNCPAGQVCGAGGPNKCGPACTPRTCAQMGANCGPAGDGCGGMLSCGMCVNGQVCGGGGLPGVCGTGTCAPLTCAQQGLACGPAGDGCGKVIQCGTCPMGQTCGGGGTPGVCGAPSCTPTTCQAQGAECGPIADGCGGILNCGTCVAPLTCGGGNKPNVCGVLG